MNENHDVDDRHEHNDFEPAEQAAALRLVEILETPPPAPTPDQRAALELAEQLRKSAATNLPPSSDTMRSALLAELSQNSDAEISPIEMDLESNLETSAVPINRLKTSSPGNYRTNRRRLWVAVACGLLIVGGAIGYSFNNIQYAQLPQGYVEPDQSPSGGFGSGSRPDEGVYLGRRQSEQPQSFAGADRAGTGPPKLTKSASGAGESDTLITFPDAEERLKKKSAREKFADARLISEQQSEQGGEGKRDVGPADGTRDSFALKAAARPQKDHPFGRFAGGQGQDALRGIGGGGGGFGGGGRGKDLAGAPSGGQTGRGEFGSSTKSIANGVTAAPKPRRTRRDGQDSKNYPYEPDNGRWRELTEAEEIIGGEQYLPIHENPFTRATGSAAVSTFSIDVDTAAYANMRRFLTSGQRPPRDSVRIEELVNYFEYDYPQPTGEHPFSVHTELADCPWQRGHQLLRIGLQGKDVHVDERPATNVVFLIDVSGSMNANDKLPLLKSGFQMLARQLGENDRVSIVTYAGQAGVALNPTPGDQTRKIENAIENLTSGGSTHGSAGIELAYKMAQQNFIHDGVNKVILATDGDLNVGVTSDQALTDLITAKAAEGVFLTVLGFGTGNLKDGKLEQLADRGNGVYAYIDNAREAHRVLVKQLSATLVTIAKDVKIQIEFNPAQVHSYRLLGYENRILATRDFDDDRKDAGEIGAGHSVTAIYQIQPTGSIDPAVRLKYQTGDDTAAATKPATDQPAGDVSGELATVALRYKQPTASSSRRLEVAIDSDSRRFDAASTDFRFATSVAGFGMLLRGSQHRGTINVGDLIKMARTALGDDAAGTRAEFTDLVRRFQSMR